MNLYCESHILVDASYNISGDGFHTYGKSLNEVADASFFGFFTSSLLTRVGGTEVTFHANTFIGFWLIHGVSELFLTACLFYIAPFILVDRFSDPLVFGVEGILGFHFPNGSFFHLFSFKLHCRFIGTFSLSKFKPLLNYFIWLITNVWSGIESYLPSKCLEILCEVDLFGFAPSFLYTGTKARFWELQVRTRWPNI